MKLTASQRKHLRERIAREKFRRISALLGPEPTRITTMRAEVAHYDKMREFDSQQDARLIEIKAGQLMENLFFKTADEALASVKEWENEK